MATYYICAYVESRVYRSLCEIEAKKAIDPRRRRHTLGKTSSYAFHSARILLTQYRYSAHNSAPHWSTTHSPSFIHKVSMIVLYYCRSTSQVSIMSHGDPDTNQIWNTADKIHWRIPWNRNTAQVHSAKIRKVHVNDVILSKFIRRTLHNCRQTRYIV